MKKTLFALALVAVSGCASISKQYVSDMEAKRIALQALYEQDLKKSDSISQADKDAWERNFRSWQALNEEAAK